MKSRVDTIVIQSFTEAQLRAILQVLQSFDVDQYRDYHDSYGVCNAPDHIESLKNEVEAALSKH
jgi:hypothetical protein